jgi:hypothetical protein
MRENFFKKSPHVNETDGNAAPSSNRDVAAFHTWRLRARENAFFFSLVRGPPLRTARREPPCDPACSVASRFGGIAFASRSTRGAVPFADAVEPRGWIHVPSSVRKFGGTTKTGRHWSHQFFKKSEKIRKKSVETYRR